MTTDAAGGERHAGTRQVLRLQLSGLVAVHAARAAHMALAGVPGIETATVTMAGAEVEVSGVTDLEAFAATVRASLLPVGVGLETISVVRRRALPQL